MVNLMKDSMKNSMKDLMKNLMTTLMKMFAMKKSTKNSTTDSAKTRCSHSLFVDVERLVVQEQEQLAGGKVRGGDGLLVLLPRREGVVLEPPQLLRAKGVLRAAARQGCRHCRAACTPPGRPAGTSRRGKRRGDDEPLVLLPRSEGVGLERL